MFTGQNSARRRAIDGNIFLSKHNTLAFAGCTRGISNASELFRFYFCVKKSSVPFIQESNSFAYIFGEIFCTEILHFRHSLGCLELVNSKLEFRGINQCVATAANKLIRKIFNGKLTIHRNTDVSAGKNCIKG